MGIGPSQKRLAPSQSSRQAGYDSGIVRVLAPILEKSADSQLGNRFSWRGRILTILYELEPNEATTIGIVSSSQLWGWYHPCPSIKTGKFSSQWGREQVFMLWAKCSHSQWVFLRAKLHCHHQNHLIALVTMEEVSSVSYYRYLKGQQPVS
jgi:hypothetical protein